MTSIRLLPTGDLARFAALATDPARVAETLAYLNTTIDAGSTKPEWCFAVEQGGEPIGRIALWSIPNGPPADFVLFDLPWDRVDIDDLAAATLQAASDIMRKHGAKHAAHMLDTPAQWPQWQTHHSVRASVLAQAGFKPRRETMRFLLLPNTPRPKVERAALEFRNLTQVGNAVFKRAMTSVTRGTFDQMTANLVTEIGADAETEQSFTELQQVGFDPSWWELAYDAENHLIGLVMPTMLGRHMGTIGYIGVVPEQRGRGYIDTLLARATDTLLSLDIQQIRADTDVSNAPMAAAFTRAGYTNFATRREYQRKLE